MSTVAERLVAEVQARWNKARRPLLLGLAGAQGSGKSTVAEAVRAGLAQAGLGVAALSLDDLYLSRRARLALAASVHPLLATRGVPGTHDLAPAWSALGAARRGEPFTLPRFDKSTDDPAPIIRHAHFDAPINVILLEGWCVGAEPQPQTALAEPVNPLEAREDADGRWRRFVNAQLAGPYRDLFVEIDLLAFLAAPSLDIVATWRGEQERTMEPTPGGRRMDAAELDRFVQHYARITEHMLKTTPGRADLTFHLDAQRAVRRITSRGG